eukprot:TRINITY_DN20689_c0_g1_i1.p1 TRINITY_DN20689_c0_g1~~TRINITY_DN20689_c0_g1_i1.p1  ORF type:complete len:542 (-),score=84.23 TRINITY_DN20689_c0_g1_i1:145-1770(-)
MDWEEPVVKDLGLTESARAHVTTEAEKVAVELLRSPKSDQKPAAEYASMQEAACSPTSMECYSKKFDGSELTGSARDHVTMQAEPSAVESARISVSGENSATKEAVMQETAFLSSPIDCRDSEAERSEQMASFKDGLGNQADASSSFQGTKPGENLAVVDSVVQGNTSVLPSEDCPDKKTEILSPTSVIIDHSFMKQAEEAGSGLLRSLKAAQEFASTRDFISYPGLPSNVKSEVFVSESGAVVNDFERADPGEPGKGLRDDTPGLDLVDDDSFWQEVVAREEALAVQESKEAAGEKLANPKSDQMKPSVPDLIEDDDFWMEVIAQDEERERQEQQRKVMQAEQAKMQKVMEERSRGQGPKNVYKVSVRPEDLQRKVWVNRAPVLCLWAAVVAQREGYSWEEGVTFGKFISAKCGAAKGHKLGFNTGSLCPGDEMGLEEFEVCGMRVPGVRTPDGVRAVLGRPLSPGVAETYLLKAFTVNLQACKVSFENLARKYSPRDIGSVAFRLYEAIRPEIPAGAAGWGAKGVLNLAVVNSMGPRNA